MFVKSSHLNRMGGTIFLHSQFHQPQLKLIRLIHRRVVITGLGVVSPVGNQVQTAPHEDGSGAMLAMQRAISDANLSADDIQYINAHATSTPIGDAIETRAIKRLFGEHAKNLAVSSTKGAHGHLLGSAGNLETVFTVLACKEGTIPPTINLDNLTEDMNLNFVPNKSQLWKRNGRRVALKNSFGFGGTNASVCIGEYVEHS